MGRPKKKIDLEKLRALSLIGCSYELIASELGISHDTLQRRYLPLVHESRGKGKVKVLGKAFQLAIGGNTRLLELFLINWLGFTLRPETQTVVNVTQNAGPVMVPSPAKMKARLLAAQKFLEEHNYGLPREQKDRSNGDSQGLPNV
jgi:hypothetical protein